MENTGLSCREPPFADIAPFCANPLYRRDLATSINGGKVRREVPAACLELVALAKCGAARRQALRYEKFTPLAYETRGTALLPCLLASVPPSTSSAHVTCRDANLRGPALLTAIVLERVPLRAQIIEPGGAWPGTVAMLFVQRNFAYAGQEAKQVYVGIDRYK